MKSINDLGRLNKDIKDTIKDMVSACIDSGWYVLGANVKDFENTFARYIGTKHCVTCANGTQALELALRALEVGHGDEVITVANAGFYSSLAILSCGGKPVYADINDNTYLVSVDSLKPLINKKTKAIIITHLFGRMADVESVLSLCRQYGIALVEDCAQAHGAFRNGKKAGSYGGVSCFSFYPTKNLGAMGDGGAVNTDNDTLAQKIKQLRQYGWGEKYSVKIPYGINSRLDEIQAVILSEKMKYLDLWNERRRAIAGRYTGFIKNINIINLPEVTGNDYVAHLYAVRALNRDSLIKHLAKEGIPCDIHYPVPDYRQDIMKDAYKDKIPEKTEMVSAQILTLPCFPEMTDEECDTVINAVNTWRV